MGEKTNTPSEADITMFLESMCTNTWYVKEYNSIAINWVYQDIQKWDKKEYAIKSQEVIWRDLTLKIDGKVSMYNQVFYVSLMVQYGGEKYHHVFTQKNHLDESFDQSFPEISVNAYKLEIRPYIKGITLTDIPLKSEEKGTSSSFRVIQEIR
jgi:hypothetical protein